MKLGMTGKFVIVAVATGCTVVMAITPPGQTAGATAVGTGKTVATTVPPPVGSPETRVPPTVYSARAFVQWHASVENAKGYRTVSVTGAGTGRMNGAAESVTAELSSTLSVTTREATAVGTAITQPITTMGESVCITGSTASTMATCGPAIDNVTVTMGL